MFLSLGFLYGPMQVRAASTHELIATYSAIYGVSASKMTKTLMCESGLKEKAYNKSDPYGGAKGIAQFLQPTFNRYSVKAGLKNGDVWNKEHAIKVMAYMWSIGEARQWSCWHKIKHYG